MGATWGKLFKDSIISNIIAFGHLNSKINIQQQISQKTEQFIGQRQHEQGNWSIN